MLKKRDLMECTILFSLITHPEVFPYVRNKAATSDEYMFLTKQLMEREEQKLAISRTILDEWGQPIGTISLYDIKDQAGFLGTWIGQPYFGKGYNKKAKDAFLTEIFTQTDIQSVYMKIRKENLRSQKAALKMPYVQVLNTTSPHYQTYSEHYHLLEIPKDLFLLHKQQVESFSITAPELREA